MTNLGVTVKDSPQNTLVFVTRLDNAAPVAGAKVSIINRDNSIHWSGTTGADGVATGPGVPYQERRYTGEQDYAEWQKPDFVVLAEKDGDIAYVGSNWNEGIEPWDFGVPFNRSEAEPMLRGTVFSDRGVYRLGEEVHFKAILRQNTPGGIRLLRSGTAGLHHAPRQPVSRRRRAHGHGQRLEQRRVDDDAAGEGRARQLLGAGGARERQAEAEDGRGRAARGRAESGARRRGAVPEGRERLVSGRGVPAAGLSRRRVAEGRARDGRRADQRRRDGALPLWRADGRAAGEVGVHAHARSLGAGGRGRQLSGRAVGVRGLE